jgi:Uma2 family endonuclease
MTVKRQDYFSAGAERVWEIDPVARTVAVYTSATQATILTPADVLDGDPVLPGLAVPVRELFAELDRHS